MCRAPNSWEVEFTAFQICPCILHKLPINLLSSAFFIRKNNQQTMVIANCCLFPTSAIIKMYAMMLFISLLTPSAKRRSILQYLFHGKFDTRVYRISHPLLSSLPPFSNPQSGPCSKHRAYFLALHSESWHRPPPDSFHLCRHPDAQAQFRFKPSRSAQHRDLRSRCSLYTQVSHSHGSIKKEEHPHD